MMVVKIKKQKAQKCVIKRKLKFEDYKNYVEATQIENKINHQEKKMYVNSPKKDPKEFLEKQTNIKNTAKTLK